MQPAVKTVSILGSGAMGSSIAAHLSNIGNESCLLDIVAANSSDDLSAVPLKKAPFQIQAHRACEISEALLVPNPADLYVRDAVKLINVSNTDNLARQLASLSCNCSSSLFFSSSAQAEFSWRSYTINTRSTSPNVKRTELNTEPMVSLSLSMVKTYMPPEDIRSVRKPLMFIGIIAISIKIVILFRTMIL